MACVLRVTAQCQMFFTGIIASLVLVKHLGKPAPADILRQYLLFLGKRVAILAFQPLQKFDGCDVGPKPCGSTARSQGVILGNGVVAIRGADFGPVADYLPPLYRWSVRLYFSRCGATALSGDNLRTVALKVSHADGFFSMRR